MRARVLSAVAGAVLILGHVPSAAAEPVDAGGTDLGDCQTELVRPEIVDRDVAKKREKREKRERGVDLVPTVYTPSTDEQDEDYRPLRGGLLGDEGTDGSDERGSAKRTAKEPTADSKRVDTNNLSVEGGLSLICR